MEHKRIEKLSDRYECVLYNTAMVTYYLDGRIGLACDPRISSTAFAQCVAPYGTVVRSHQGRMFWRVGENFYHEGAERLKFKPTDEGENTWQLINEPDKIYESSLNRTKAAAVRKRAKDFKLWWELTERLNPSRRPKWSLLPMSADEALVALDNIERFGDLADHVGDLQKLYPLLYKYAEASTETLAPHSRLPRRSK